jgi:hypothetical protein
MNNAVISSTPFHTRLVCQHLMIILYLPSRYLIRDPVTTAIPGKDNAPILFLHGLGIGITQYHLVITEFLSNPAFNSRAIVIVIQPHITQSLFHPRHLSPLNREKTVRDLRGLILKTLNSNKASAPRQKVVVLSHSLSVVSALIWLKRWLIILMFVAALSLMLGCSKPIRNLLRDRASLIQVDESSFFIPYLWSYL